MLSRVALVQSHMHIYTQHSSVCSSVLAQINKLTALLTGSPTQLLLTLTSRHGPETLRVQEAALVEVSSSGVAMGTVQEMGRGNFLVSVGSAPAGEFVVLLKGEDTSTSIQFQRQSTTEMSVTPVSVKVCHTCLRQGAQKAPYTYSGVKSGVNRIS